MAGKNSGLPDWPTMVDGDITTVGGNYYIQNPETGMYTQIECYLPGSPKTYYMDNWEDVFKRQCERLRNGDLTIRLKTNHLILVKGKMKRVKSVKVETY